MLKEYKTLSFTVLSEDMYGHVHSSDPHVLEPTPKDISALIELSKTESMRHVYLYDDRLSPNALSAVLSHMFEQYEIAINSDQSITLTYPLS